MAIFERYLLLGPIFHWTMIMGGRGVNPYKFNDFNYPTSTGEFAGFLKHQLLPEVLCVFFGGWCLESLRDRSCWFGSIVKNPMTNPWRMGICTQAISPLKHVAILSPKSCTFWSTNIAGWNIPMFNRKHLFKRVHFPASYVSLPGG